MFDLKIMKNIDSVITLLVISYTIFYSIPTQCASYAYLGHKLGDFPESEFCSDNGTHIGVHQDLEITQLDYVGEVVDEFLKSKGLDIEQNTLYPLLRRLDGQGLLESTWEVVEPRPRKYYQLSSNGKIVLSELKIDYKNNYKTISLMLEEE